MADEYSERLCDDRHAEISRKFDILFKKMDLMGIITAGLIIIGIIVSIITKVPMAQ